MTVARTRGFLYSLAPVQSEEAVAEAVELLQDALGAAAWMGADGA